MAGGSPGSVFQKRSWGLSLHTHKAFCSAFQSEGHVLAITGTPEMLFESGEQPTYSRAAPSACQEGCLKELRAGIFLSDISPGLQTHFLPIKPPPGGWRPRLAAGHPVVCPIVKFMCLQSDYCSSGAIFPGNSILQSLLGP